MQQISPSGFTVHTLTPQIIAKCKVCTSPSSWYGPVTLAVSHIYDLITSATSTFDNPAAGHSLKLTANLVNCSPSTEPILLHQIDFIGYLIYYKRFYILRLIRIQQRISNHFICWNGNFFTSAKINCA